MKHSGGSGKAVNVYGARRGASPCAFLRVVLGIACAALGAVARLPAQPSPQPAAVPEAQATAPAVPKLDLRPGDLRRFVPPEDLYEPWTSELDEVVIRPRRGPPDLPERRAVPQGLGGLWWAARRPTQSWRLFVPDPNADPDAPATRPRSPDDPQPPPGSWRLRLEPNGKVW